MNDGIRLPSSFVFGHSLACVKNTLKCYLYT
jgi:hypothetical protein